jgi:hypothetical protein
MWIRDVHFSISCLGSARNLLTRGTGATSLTWVILANIFHINTCKDKFYWNWPPASGEEDFFQCKHIEIWFFPIVAPSDPRGPCFVQTWIYIISESFHVNMSSSGSVVLEKKIFKWLHPIFAFLWLSPLWKGPGPWFVQFWIPFT